VNVAPPPAATSAPQNEPGASAPSKPEKRHAAAARVAPKKAEPKAPATAAPADGSDASAPLAAAAASTDTSTNAPPPPAAGPSSANADSAIATVPIKDRPVEAPAEQPSEPSRGIPVSTMLLAGGLGLGILGIVTMLTRRNRETSVSISPAHDLTAPHHL
jgi:hypothetical protein